MFPNETTMIAVLLAAIYWAALAIDSDGGNNEDSKTRRLRKGVGRMISGNKKLHTKSHELSNSQRPRIHNIQERYTYTSGLTK
uniref:Secreted protein n=1 Tax=Romanomermis culicivorax TaxID=13658 RepID=A0A915KDX7_ROMCU